MKLKALSLINYKNFESKSFSFDEKINCFVGENGIGKTNILDAIYHLALGKSYFNPIASQNIKHGEAFFVVDGVFEKSNEEEKIIVSLKRGQKKVIKRNGKPYERFSDHIGFIPVVIISPSDRDLITEGSDTRRKFMDSVISQNDKVYLNNLINYNKVLSQRNALLKYFALNNTFNSETLDVYNAQLHEYGSAIFEVRQQFTEAFTPIFNTHYKAISNGKEQVTLSYKSDLINTKLITLLEQNVFKDRTLQYTSVGTHKDDLNFLIEGHPIKSLVAKANKNHFL